MNYISLLLLLLLFSVQADISTSPLTNHKIAAGDSHFCAIDNANWVYCWGSGSNYKLGTGTQSDQSAPVKLTEQAIAVCTGAQFTCILTLLGKFRCVGQIDLGGGGASSTFGTFGSANVYTILACGYNHVCAYGSVGLHCFGENSYGQLGDGTRTRRSYGVIISGFSNILSISMGVDHTCIVNGGSLYCAGSNGYGQVGLGLPSSTLYVTTFTFTGASVNSVHCGYYHTCLYLNYFNGGSWVQGVQCAGLRDAFGGARNSGYDYSFVNVNFPTLLRPLTLGVYFTYFTSLAGNGNVQITVMGTNDYLNPDTPPMALTTRTSTTFNANLQVNEVQIAVGLRTTCTLIEATGAVECIGVRPYSGTILSTTPPTSQLTAIPTAQPTSLPTSIPTTLPTMLATGQPTTDPTFNPTTQPTSLPTPIPTAQPTSQPTSIPTTLPTLLPTVPPTTQPTSQPTSIPTTLPTVQPTTQPTGQPTVQPTTNPTFQPTTNPTFNPTLPGATKIPTIQPTTSPTKKPSYGPTNEPSQGPTNEPSYAPTKEPSYASTKEPSYGPTVTPTKARSQALPNTGTRTSYIGLVGLIPVLFLY